MQYTLVEFEADQKSSVRKGKLVRDLKEELIIEYIFNNPEKVFYVQRQVTKGIFELIQIGEFRQLKTSTLK